MSQQISFRADLVHESAFVAKNATVVGDVTLEDESSVWFNAVLRGDTAPIRIGRRTNIQDGAVIHADDGFPCTIGQGVTVGHNAVVHGCVIQDNVLIGMGSVVMNGATVGENSIVAVGAVVTENVVSPAGSLVAGLPARRIRSMEDDDIARIVQAADHYVDNARRYKEHGQF